MFMTIWHQLSLMQFLLIIHTNFIAKCQNCYQFMLLLLLNFYGSSIRLAHSIAQPKRQVMNFYHQQRLQRKLHLELIIMDKVQFTLLMHHCWLCSWHCGGNRCHEFLWLRPCAAWLAFGLIFVKERDTRMWFCFEMCYLHFCLELCSLLFVFFF